MESQLFVWSDSFALGEATIDAQHRHLVELTNGLYGAAVDEGLGLEQRLHLLDGLIDYATEHFGYEERKMADEAACAHHREDHAQEHREFTNVMRGARQMAATDGASLSRLVAYLGQWLLTHILDTDREMVTIIATGCPQPHIEEAQRAANAQRRRALQQASAHMLGAMQTAATQLRGLADAVPALIWRGDREGRSYLNERWREHTGRSLTELQGAGWQASVHAEDRAKVLAAERRALGGEGEAGVEYRLEDAHGRPVWMSERIVAESDGGLLGVAVSIAEQRAREEALDADLARARRQMVQSEKLAGIGQLAAGVAHEINNPIGYVTSNLSTLADYLLALQRMLAGYAEMEGELSEASRQRLAQLRQETDLEYILADLSGLVTQSREGLSRVKAIVRGLLNFARAENAGERAWVDLNVAAETVLNLVWNEIKYKAEVVRDFAEVPVVWCEPGPINQVLLNLIVNAAQSIETNGQITLRTRAERGGVVLAVEDTGSGISSANLAHIFEPFFTTKQPGKGTGLGLAVSHGIVEGNGGRLEVESEPGVGTTFSLWLPCQAAKDVA